ncbi:hypothetical protein [Candidatus Cetobacterium colombiensis]|uniref:YokE-like PH domain-containing protein n=1 Tax=Candidatus Cetobacterium colombiensis TaxID=3073100 RepID=A0ABU4W9G4_9FUSO|nr:hypothetical protein [Candidatus Cetobacterium colombiensis]MDX8336179.1 hypothetical protein [Candidatus Cetobacterium colombiensis]
MPVYFRLLWEVLTFPFTKMSRIILEDSINKEYHRLLLNSNEEIITCYDNHFKSFLITNMRIISIQKLKVTSEFNLVSKIFSIPLNQVGTTEMFGLKFFHINVLRITTAPGFKFYWFFKKSVSMEELSKTIIRVSDDVQGVSK